MRSLDPNPNQVQGHTHPRCGSKQGYPNDWLASCPSRCKKACFLCFDRKESQSRIKGHSSVTCIMHHCPSVDRIAAPHTASHSYSLSLNRTKERWVVATLHPIDCDETSQVLPIGDSQNAAQHHNTTKLPSPSLPSTIQDH
jgi:hypothetical protein